MARARSLLVALAAAGLAAAGPGALAPPAPAQTRAQASGVPGGTGTDYHVEAFGDPLDFSNPEDHVIADEAMLYGASNAWMSDGQLHLELRGPSYFSIVHGGYPTGIPHGRDGATHPIDTTHYTRLVLRMRAPLGIPAAVRWFTCLKADDSCSGGTKFTTGEGWQTYDIPLAPNSDDPVLAQPWAGAVTTVRVLLSPPGPALVDVDWARLVPADLSPVDELVGAAPPVRLPTDRLDYATAAGGAWDWDSAADGSPVHLRNVQVGGGRLSACNTPVTSGPGDPGVVLRLPGGRPIDADRFTTLTVEYGYDGPFSARNEVNGGMVARVFWNDAQGRHPTKGIHLYPNQRYFTIRLDDPQTVFEGIEPGKGVVTGAPWRGQVTAFRFDPNQDRGGRCWWIGRIWLTADEPASPAATQAATAPAPNAPAIRTAATKTARRGATTTRKRVAPTTRRVGATGATPASTPKG